VKREAAFWFGEADLAPVALFRIAFGILTVNWFWQVFPNLSEFFTDEGLFPRVSQVQFFPLHFTLLNAAGDWWQVAVLWAIALAAAVAVAVGYRTRLALVVTYVMLASFALRDPLVGDASDQVFRAAAFWLIFTAAGNRYSLDAWLRARRGLPLPALGWALPIRVVELQFAWIYLATGLEKMAGGLWRDGLAVYYSLQLEHTFARPWAAPLAQNVELARFATQLTVVAELAFLPLVFVPVIRRFGRPIAVLIAAGLHTNIALFMNVGNFPLIMLAGLIPFLPPSLVMRVAARLRLPDPARIEERADRAHERGPQLGRWRRRVAGAGLIALALVVFSTSLPSYAAVGRPEAVDRALRWADLLQKWNMFAPDPPTADGWLTIPAVLVDGTRIDLVTGKPPSDAALYADPLYSRWTKVAEWIASAAHVEYRQEHARMYCRLRNLHLRPGQSPLVSFDVLYMEQPIAAPGRAAAPLRRIVLNSHKC
jgi:hypothetical protein